MTQRQSKFCEIKILENGGYVQVTAQCGCPKTDTWHDYLAHMKAAAMAYRVENSKAYAMYLRDALRSLFAHLEAIVDECGRILDWPSQHSRPLMARIRGLGAEVRRSGRVKVPSTHHWHRWKRIRDQLAHPSVETSFDGVRDSRSEFSDGWNVVYEQLDYQGLKRLESEVVAWAEVICGHFDINPIEPIGEEFSDFLTDLSLTLGGKLQTLMPEGGPTE